VTATTDPRVQKSDDGVYVTTDGVWRFVPNGDGWDAFVAGQSQTPHNDGLLESLDYAIVWAIGPQSPEAGS
jgi:hypothetical protein